MARPNTDTFCVVCACKKDGAYRFSQMHKQRVHGQVVTDLSRCVARVRLKREDVDKVWALLTCQDKTIHGRAFSRALTKADLASDSQVDRQIRDRLEATKDVDAIHTELR